MSYQRAKKILTEIRTNHIRVAANDPKMWDLSLALEEMCSGIQQQLDQIQQNQATIAQMLQHKR